MPYQGVEYNEDLTRFVPDVFAALKTCLQQQEHALESASSAELAKARVDVSELLQDVDCATRTAARQMIYAYSRKRFRRTRTKCHVPGRATPVPAMPISIVWKANP